MGVQVADTLAWLSDELRSECSQPVLQRARGIANQWRSKMEDLHCLNDTASNRITLYATIRGTTSPSSRYEVQATLDFADELFLARYCSCPAFSGSQRGYGSYRTFDYHNSPKYRSFDDDDDYDYVDDYDDFGSGSTYGHVNDDDDSASSTSRRYTGMCKHVAAMLLLFLQQPERFRGFHAAAATPRALADYMRSLDAKSNNAGENAQLDVLKRIINAKSRLIEEQRGASGQGAAKPKRKSSAPVDVKPGSVYLEPTLINGHDALRLSLRIGCGDADYALKNISRFVADMRTGTYESYGKKLAFTHTPDMLDPFSLKLYRFLQQVIASRTAAQLQNGYYYGEAVRVDRELVLTDWEACDLLDLFHAVTQDEYKEHESKARGVLRTSDGDGLRRLLIEDFQRTKESGPSRIHMANEGGEPFGLDIVEGDPTFTFKASFVHEGTASGVRITSNQSISDVINGRNGFYVFSRERPDDSTATDRIGIDGLFRCTDKLRPALQVLPDLCSDDPDGVFIAENDWPMFARTIVPKLTEAGIGFDIPQEVTEAVGTECRIEFYLDRDLYGITCEAVAKYGDFTFQLVPTAKELQSTGQLAVFSFGQGSFTATPLQITAMMNTIAGGGTYHTPRFCYGVTDAGGTLTDPFQLPAPRIVCDAATAKTLRSMLQSVVEDGIGHAAKPAGGTAAGKTGTAQTGQFDAAGDELLNYWFSGFTPVQTPKYTITVLQDGVLEPETSSAALFAKIAEGLQVIEQPASD